MGCNREGASLWFHLGFWENYAGRGKRKWRLPEFIKRKRWNSKYFWQDTFLTHWNRFLGCKIFGHRNVKSIDDDNGLRKDFCFNCYKDIS